MDEVRVADGVLSAERIRTAYLIETDAMLRYAPILPTGMTLIVR